MEINKIYQGDSLDILKIFPSESVDCAITSPPYWALRDYGVDGQLGLEPTFQEYISKLCDIFDEVKRVLKKEGTCFVNLGDTYSGNKNGKTDYKVSDYLKENSQGIKKKATITEKSLCQIPSRFAIAMADRGWILRNRIIWHKTNCMPASVTDRFTVDYEDIFFFVKNKKYWFEQQNEPLSKTTIKRLEHNWNCRPNAKLASGTIGGMTDIGFNKAVKSMKEKGTRNKRCVWAIPTKSFSEAHFATFPEELIVPMILAGCPPKGIVLDIFMGAGTTALVAKKLGRKYIGIELNPEYIKIAEKRLAQENLF